MGDKRHKKYFSFNIELKTKLSFLSCENVRTFERPHEPSLPEECTPPVPVSSAAATDWHAAHGDTVHKLSLTFQLQPALTPHSGHSFSTSTSW